MISLLEGPGLSHAGAGRTLHQAAQVGAAGLPGGDGDPDLVLVGGDPGQDGLQASGPGGPGRAPGPRLGGVTLQPQQERPDLDVGLRVPALAPVRPDLTAVVTDTLQRNRSVCSR